jgi:hypothetical protein
MTDLSPAAQVVWDAFASAPTCAEVKLAAALCAAADQVEPDDGVPSEVRRVLDDLLAIAAELDGTNSPSENV